MQPLQPSTTLFHQCVRSAKTYPKAFKPRLNHISSVYHHPISPSTWSGLLGRGSSIRRFDDASQAGYARKQSTLRNESQATSKGRPDHRVIGVQQNLWTHHPAAPGSPFFLPAGAHILQKLIEFLRAQYSAHGFQEVLTPLLYKQSLWERSGHWANYKNNMYSVKGGSSDSKIEKEEYGLKPMNCPGHCLLFASKRRSYRDLPIRYADFSPLHRDEISGALSGLTRVRRFHQDDGHIFCRPNQLQEEVMAQLQLIKMVYSVFGLKVHTINLSTRPEEGFLGKIDEWEAAEHHLKEALQDSGMEWKINPADGAFYGPKIDVIVQDSDGKEHQTATIQLDFQLPKRFELKYDTEDEAVQERPVMVHRAIFGSLERFMALLTEQYDGCWPFWLSPSQVIILTVNDNQGNMEYVRSVAALLRQTRPHTLQELNAPVFAVDTDSSGDSIGKKIARAKGRPGPRYNVICVIGQRNVESNTLDLDLSAMPQVDRVREDLKVYRQHLKRAEDETLDIAMNFPKVTLHPDAFVKLMKHWTKNYF